MEGYSATCNFLSMLQTSDTKIRPLIDGLYNSSTGLVCYIFAFADDIICNCLIFIAFEFRLWVYS